MAVNLQIAIPLFAAFIVLLAIAAVRKYIKPEAVIIGTVILALGVGALTLDLGTQKAKENAQGMLAESETASLMLAQKYILQGHYDEASKVLDSIGKTNADDARVVLADARLSLLDGDSERAVLLYRQLGEKYKTEAGYAYDVFLSQRAIQTPNASDEQESDTDIDTLDFATMQEKVVDTEKIKAEILSAVQADVNTLENVLSFDTVQAVKDASEILRYFNSLSLGSEIDMQQFEAVCASLYEHMTANKRLTQNSHLRIALLKGNVAVGNYSDITKMADGNVTSEELIVITELYTRGLIYAKDFSEVYVNKDRAVAKNIAELCSEILENNKDNLKNYEYDRYKQQIDALKAQITDPVGFTLRSTIVDKAQNDSPKMRSKLYLAIAKLESFYGNEALANKYMEYAFGASGDSDDDNYRVPMMQLSAIIRGDANPEEIKNVATYVDLAVDNSLPAGLSTNVHIRIPYQEHTLGVEQMSHNSNFRLEMANKVNKSTAMLNIGKINTGSFPVVSARVQIQSNNRKDTDDIRNHLDVYDCGNKISDFTLEKMQFERSRIVLLCDVSDSMQESVEDLKNAIISFADDMQESEEVGVVGFGDGGGFALPFSNDPEVVKSYALAVYEKGTTQTFSSLPEIIDTYFSEDITSNDIIIAMTNGRDKTNSHRDSMYGLLCQKAHQKGITVYTVGIGNVDAEYLQTISIEGNGSFLYADSNTKLESFYDFIHGQLFNQYILTYTSKNLVQNQRFMEMSLEGELAKDEKVYCIAEDLDDNDNVPDAEPPFNVTDTPLSVYGLSAKRLYKSSKNQVIQLKGTGFGQDMEISARLKGNVNYEPVVNFADEQTYELIIPGEIAVGTYDLMFSVGDISVVMEKELEILAKATGKQVGIVEYAFADNEDNTNAQKGE